MSWVIRRADVLWCVGFFTPAGDWEIFEGGLTKTEATEMVHYLNGGN